MTNEEECQKKIIGLMNMSKSNSTPDIFKKWFQVYDECHSVLKNEKVYSEFLGQLSSDKKNIIDILNKNNRDVFPIAVETAVYCINLKGSLHCIRKNLSWKYYISKTIENPSLFVLWHLW